MTVDVEDYFHVSAFDNVVSRAGWDALREPRVAQHRSPARGLRPRGRAQHVLRAGWVADRFPALVRRIADQGHEIASHGYHHQLLYMLTPDQFREDVRAAKTAIENASGRRVLGFRAPSYSIIESSMWAIDILIEEGHVYDSSIFPIHHDRYGIPYSPRHPYTLHRAAGSLLEVPGSTVRLARRQPADRRRRLFPPAAVCLDEVGHRPRQSARARAGRVLHPSMGNRPGSAADAGRRGNPRAPLSRPRTHQRSSAAPAAGLPLRRDRVGDGSRAVERGMTNSAATAPETAATFRIAASDEAPVVTVESDAAAHGRPTSRPSSRRHWLSRLARGATSSSARSATTRSISPLAATIGSSACCRRCSSTAGCSDGR